MKVKCDKCGKEHNTRLWQKGDKHKDCGGQFVPEIVKKCKGLL